MNDCRTTRFSANIALIASTNPAEPITSRCDLPLFGVCSLPEWDREEMRRTSYGLRISLLLGGAVFAGWNAAHLVVLAAPASQPAPKKVDPHQIEELVQQGIDGLSVGAATPARDSF